jgi:hypothetical protein
VDAKYILPNPYTNRPNDTSINKYAAPSPGYNTTTTERITDIIPDIALNILSPTERLLKPTSEIDSIPAKKRPIESSKMRVSIPHPG